MNILLIHQYFLEENDPGGSRFNEMTKVWVEQGHRVVVVCGMVNYVTGRIPEKYANKRFHMSSYQEGLDVLRCYVSPEYNTSFVGRMWAYFSFVWFGLCGIFFRLRGRRFDVIMATSPPLFIGIIAWVASKIKRIPYVFEVRDLWPESAIDTGVLTNPMIIRLAYFFENLFYRHAKLINVLTPAFRNALIERKGIDAEKIIFIPNACDFAMTDYLLDNFDSAAFRKELGWQDQFVLTYVGAHGVANHLVQLLDAAETLQDLPIRIVLIGDGMQKTALMTMAKERRLGNVQFIDPMPKREVMKYILASDAGISVLKKADTFKTVYSNKTFDYMSCKKAIIMAIDGVSRELVEEAQCGVYAEPENIKDLVDKIRGLSQTPDRCKEMGENGYTFAKGHFDRYVLATRYTDQIRTKFSHV